MYIIITWIIKVEKVIPSTQKILKFQNKASELENLHHSIFKSSFKFHCVADIYLNAPHVNEHVSCSN